MGFAVMIKPAKTAVDPFSKLAHKEKQIYNLPKSGLQILSPKLSDCTRQKPGRNLKENR